MSDLPEPGHHLYVMAFSDGVVKVGRSSNWRRRTRQHRFEARNRGAAYVKGWLSSSHEYADVLEGELALKEFCAGRWPAAWGTEYFDGADFDEVAEYAEGLNDVLLIFAGRAEHLLYRPAA